MHIQFGKYDVVHVYKILLTCVLVSTTSAWWYTKRSMFPVNVCIHEYDQSKGVGVIMRPIDPLYYITCSILYIP